MKNNFNVFKNTLLEKTHCDFGYYKYQMAKKKKLVTDNIGLRHSVQKYLTVKMKK